MNARKIEWVIPPKADIAFEVISFSLRCTSEWIPDIEEALS